MEAGASGESWAHLCRAAEAVFFKLRDVWYRCWGVETGFNACAYGLWAIYAKTGSCPFCLTRLRVVLIVAYSSCWL